MSSFSYLPSPAKAAQETSSKKDLEYKNWRMGAFDEVLSSGYYRTIVLMESQQVWWPAEDLQQIKATDNWPWMIQELGVLPHVEELLVTDDCLVWELRVFEECVCWYITHSLDDRAMLMPIWAAPTQLSGLFKKKKECKGDIFGDPMRERRRI